MAQLKDKLIASILQLAYYIRCYYQVLVSDSIFMKIKNIKLFAALLLFLPVLAACNVIDRARHKQKMQGVRVDIVADASVHNGLNEVDACRDLKQGRHSLALVAKKKIDRLNSFGFSSRPILVGGKVIVLTSFGELVAYDEGLSKIIWRTKLGLKDHSTIMSNFAVDKEVLYASVGVNILYAIDTKTGQLQWSTELDDVIRSAPLIKNGKLFLHGAQNHVYALDQASGRVLWRHEKDVMELSAALGSEPVMIGDDVAVQIANKEILLFEQNSGTLVGSIPLSLWNDYLMRNEKTHLPNFFLLDERTVYAVSHHGKITAINLDAAQVSWSSQINPITRFVIDRDSLYVVSDRQQLLAVDKKTGGVSWAVDLGKCLQKERAKSYWSAPLIDNEQLLLTHCSGAIFAFDRITGRLLWNFDQKMGLVTSEIAVSPEYIYVVSNDGDLYKYKK